jgi:hypothetical protein
MTFHHPVITPDADEADEKHWRRTAVGEQIKSAWQAYILLPQPHWRISAFYTSDREVVSGRTSYRAPNSLKAWCSVLPELTRKWVRRWRGLA